MDAAPASRGPYFAARRSSAAHIEGPPNENPQMIRRAFG